jgi:hypothetical protein
VWVQVSFDGTQVHFSFVIPQGPQGTPGEVSSAQLNDAIQGTSSNSNAVSQLSSFAPPEYDPTQCQAMIDKLNELIQALRR